MFAGNIKSFSQNFTQDTGKKLATIFGAIFVLMLLIVFVTLFIYQQRLLEEQRENHFKTITNTLVAGIEKVSFSGKYHSKQFIDETVKNNENIFYMVLQDERGGVIAASDLSGIKENILPVDQEFLEKVFLKKEPFVRDIVCTLEGGRISLKESSIAYTSGYGGTSKKYIMRIGISVENIDRAFFRGMFYFGLLFLVVAAVGIASILLISGYFATPIKKLAFELKGILDRAPFMMYFIDREGVLEKCSSSFEREFLNQKSGHNFYDGIDIEGLARFKTEDEAIFNGMDIDGSEYVINVSGQKKHYIFIRFPVLKNSKSGEVELLGGIAIDITEMRKREKEIEFWKDRYELIINSTNDGFWDWWMGSSTIYLSPRYYEMLGYAYGQEGQDSVNRWFEIMYPEDRGRLQSVIAAIIDKRNPTSFFDGEFRFKHQDGTLRWLQIKGKAVYGERGTVVRFVGIATDITAKKDIEERIRISQEELSELNKNLEIRITEEVKKNREKDEVMVKQARLAAMGEMISNIAHQWRQPLTTLGGVIMNLQDSYEMGELDNHKFVEFVKKANEVILYMSRTIDDFRNFFRPDKKLEMFNIRETISKVLMIVDASLRHNSIRVELEAPQDVVITGYPNEYAQVMLNIINNAKDALLDRKIEEPCIKVSLKKAGETSMLSISDNAGGIAPDIMDKIFEPYFTTKDILNGTGIGLYMAKMIIEKNMGGKIVALNNQDGAEFRVII